MHTHTQTCVQVAEEGIAAHWIYKGGGEGVKEAQRFTWLRQLVEWVQQLNDPQVGCLLHLALRMCSCHAALMHAVLSTSSVRICLFLICITCT
jgi:(p)ppGpp synthase/HD superfamily hydrolase